MSQKYKNTMSKIQASDKFKAETLAKMNNYKESGGNMKISKKMISLAACVVLAIGILGFMNNQNIDNGQINSMDLTQRIKVDKNAPDGKKAVNIEGVIVEVNEDGLGFTLDNGTKVRINDDTELGITGPTAAPKDQQYFEPTFRVGNSIAGFTLDKDKKDVLAYAIYTNWNWDDPIRK